MADPVSTWFQTPAFATRFIKPKTLDELKAIDLESMPYFCIGAGSNTLIRDGGFEGTIIKLVGDFTKITIEENEMTVGAGCLNRMAVHRALEHHLSGLEFLIGIPGTIGGAVAMNAGALSRETKDILIRCETMMPDKTIMILENLDMHYRHTKLPQGAIILNATFKLTRKSPFEIESIIHHYLEHRHDTQPIKGRTGGSTFKNPSHEQRAWQCIEAVGLRGYRIGDAEFSQKHCNFIMNIGNATAEDIESLGELARARVKDHLGIDLEWEIKRIGNPKKC